MNVYNLQRGDLVVAAIDIDSAGTEISKGTLGVVFEEADSYGDQGGPMVRWFTGVACNVYEGDVMSPDEQDEDVDEASAV